MRFKPIIVFLSVFSIFWASLAPASQAQSSNWQDKVDPWLLGQIAQASQANLPLNATEFLVFLNEQADLSGADALPTKLEKGRYVYQQLKETANRTQGPLLDALKQQGAEVRSYWVANMIWVRGDASLVQKAAQRPDVAHIYGNPLEKADIPVPENSINGPNQAQSIPWGILKVNAPELWAKGISGQGVVIGGQDTGYEWQHPALINKYRGWDGSAANHDYNWHDAIHTGSLASCPHDSPQPCDDYGHGTHTMGTMVGDDGAGNQIGVAPGAKWIGCRNMYLGAGTPATYAECFQWFIAPTKIDGSGADPSKAPDIISNSWSCTVGEGCTTGSELLSIVHAVRQAGILIVSSAGNNGSGCSSVNNPAGMYADVLTVGNTDSNDMINPSSSRGPVTTDGSNRIKPDVSAPGTNVLSSIPGNQYGMLSGTSMAAPHVSGMAALLLSAEPALRGQVSEIENRIKYSTVPLTSAQNCAGVAGISIPNNTYGWGRISATNHNLVVTDTVSTPQAFTGDIITYTLAVNHHSLVSATQNVLLTDTLPAGVVFIGATPGYNLASNTVSWNLGALGANERRMVKVAVRAAFDQTGKLTNQAIYASSADVAPVSGSPLSITAYRLPVYMSASSDKAQFGGLITYTVRVQNPHLTATTHHVVLTDTLPASTKLVSASGIYTETNGIVRWTIDQIEPGSTASVTLVVRIPLSGPASLVNRDYYATSNEAPLPQPGPEIVTYLGWVYYLLFIWK